MTIHTRTIAAVAVACGVMTGLVFGQAAGTPAPQGNSRPGRPRRRKAAAEKPDSAARRLREAGRRRTCRRLYAIHASARAGGRARQGQGAVRRPTARAATPPIFAAPPTGRTRTCFARALRCAIRKARLIGARVAKHTPPITLNRSGYAWRSPNTSTACTPRWAGRGVPPGRNPTNVTLERARRRSEDR